MTTIKTRIAALEQSNERQQQRKTGPASIVEDVRAMLERIDGQVELGMRPDENLSTVMTRRLMHLDGWNLNALPGNSRDEKMRIADLAANNASFVISDEARHAARYYIQMYEGI